MTGTIKKVTVNYNFRIPVFDAPGWGREIERNFDVIDSALFAATGLGNVKGVWANGENYLVGERVADDVGLLWVSNIAHLSALSGTFEDARTAHPTYWTQVTTSTAYRGDWSTGVQYNTNDFITDGYRYGIATRSFISSASYNDDVSNGDIVTLIDLTGDIVTIVGYLSAAQTSETNAATSESNAATSENNAATSEGNAATSEANALSYMNTALSTYANLAGGSPGQVLVKDTATNFDFMWVALPGGGDMLQATYDPNNVGLDAFDMDNMVEGATTKIMTDAERSKLGGIESGADVTDAGNVEPVLTALTAKASVVDADSVVIIDSAASGAPKKTLWSVIKSTLKTYFDTLYPPVSRLVSAGTGLTGGGSLAADRSLAVSFGTSAGTVAQGNDSRITGALQRAGGTMTGKITLDGDPSSALHPGSKQYIDGHDLGIGQTHQGVTRTVGTSYQNTTGKPIVCYGRLAVSGTARAQISTDNSTWVDAMSAGTAEALSFSFVVPPGHYYRTTVGGAVTQELR